MTKRKQVLVIDHSHMELETVNLEPKDLHSKASVMKKNTQ